ncbi:hypothetical protein [Leeia oryzae]|uniref:hypothetical protein n=1 Tax=Leeia oryzae TaxID=356662 RepID=UPI000370AA36|nr:hypothetical protein [Leeia oryzae]
MLNKQFSDDALARIREEALIYQCACPAQVCEALGHLRQVFDYQLSCMSKPSLLDTEGKVHQEIAQSTALAHAELEACLDRVLTLEGWDRNTFSMPAGLREKLTEAILSDKS